MSTSPISIQQKSPPYTLAEWKKAEKPFRFIDRDLVKKTTAIFINVKGQEEDPHDMTLQQYADILKKYVKSPRESERSKEFSGASPKAYFLEKPKQ